MTARHEESGVQRVLRTGLLAVLAAGLGAAPALARQITGTAKVIDGDSLSVAGVTVRLFGIDAPELDQSCFRDGAQGFCGREAKERLEGLIGGGSINCRQVETDRYGRAVAVCQIGGDDLGRAMVASGWATAFRRYSSDYLADEDQARARRLGLWASDFARPEDYRAAKRNADVSSHVSSGRATQTTRRPFSGCVIKGNRNRRGQWIYHLPGMPYYDDTRAEEFFCTEEQAQAAGYRRTMVQ